MIAHLSTRHAKASGAKTFRFKAARHAMAALVALAAIGIASPAAPQGAAPTAAPARQPSPAAILLAKQIVDIKNVKDIFQPIVVGVVEKTRQVFMQTNFMWAKDLNEVAADAHKQFDPRVSELIDASARIYATHFSEQELKDLLAFYQSPLGKKVLAEEPKVLDESMVFAGTWADNLSADVMAKMRADMKKRGHDM
jgi:hypothetical protein